MTNQKQYVIVWSSRKTVICKKMQEKGKDMLTVIKFYKSSYSCKHSSYFKKNSILMRFCINENSV